MSFPNIAAARRQTAALVICQAKEAAGPDLYRGKALTRPNTELERSPSAAKGSRRRGSALDTLVSASQDTMLAMSVNASPRRRETQCRPIILLTQRKLAASTPRKALCWSKCRLAGVGQAQFDAIGAATVVCQDAERVFKDIERRKSAPASRRPSPLFFCIAARIDCCR